MHMRCLFYKVTRPLAFEGAPLASGRRALRYVHRARHTETQAEGATATVQQRTAATDARGADPTRYRCSAPIVQPSGVGGALWRHSPRIVRPHIVILQVCILGTDVLAPDVVLSEPARDAALGNEAVDLVAVKEDVIYGHLCVG